MLALPPSSASGFVAALRRYVGRLKYIPGKTTFVKETATGPRGFTDCGGLPMLAARDVGLIASATDLNFPGALNRETEILRVLHRIGRRVRPATPFQIGDVLVSGSTGSLHVVTITELLRDTFNLIEAPRAHGLVCERALDKHETWRSAFRLF